MSERILNLKCLNGVLTVVSDTGINSGGKNYNKVKFEVDSEWNGYTKTASFVLSEDVFYQIALDNHNEAFIPREVINTERTIEIGLFGVSGDSRITSSRVRIRINAGGYCDGTSQPETQDVISDLRAQINSKLDDASHSVHRTHLSTYLQETSPVKSTSTAVTSIADIVNLIEASRPTALDAAPDVVWVKIGGNLATAMQLKTSTAYAAVQHIHDDYTGDPNKLYIYVFEEDRWFSANYTTSLTQHELKEIAQWVNITQIKEDVFDWLEEHPEATTTVQDHSLTHQKLVTGTLNFVTPEMFGAKGDGVTDDTTAIQAAVDSGFSVKFSGGTYKCGKIEITHNCEIDCSDSSFICTGNILFDCIGSVKSTYTGTNYTKWQDHYSLGSGKTHTGLVAIKGTNNAFHARPYYCGGFVGLSYNGVLQGSYPINVYNTDGVNTADITEINSIKVLIRNINDVEFSGPSGSVVVHFFRNEGSVAKNIRQRSSCYSVVQFDTCYGCFAENCDIVLGVYSGQTAYNYPVHILDSSFCGVYNCNVFNHQWHCASTAGTYLCYRNTIKNCVLHSDRGYPAYHDHDNGIGTVIENSEISSITIGALGYINNIELLSCGTDNNNNYHLACIQVQATDDVDIADYVIKNVRIIGDTAGNKLYCGLCAYISTQTDDATIYHIRNIDIENVLTDCIDFGTITKRAGISGRQELDQLLINTINIDTSNLKIQVACDVLNVKNLKRTCESNTPLPQIGHSSYPIGTINVFNSEIGAFASIPEGSSRKIYLNNVIFTVQTGDLLSTYFICNSDVMMPLSVLKGGKVYAKNSLVGTSAANRVYRDVVGIGGAGYFGSYKTTGYELSAIK